jgi:hypothetical protein
LLERTQRARRATRLHLERLGDRIVPATVAWTNGTGSGLASAAANWTDTLYGTHYVPGANDYVLFGTDVGGSNTSCTVNISLSVDRVVMDSTYTATLTVNSATTLALTNIFAQYGRLNLVGSAAVDAGDYINLNGPVATLPGMGGGRPTLAAAGSFFINSTTTITATASMPGAGLTLSAISFDDSGTISVGTATSPGFLTASGSFVENSGAAITVFGGSTLTFDTGGSSSAVADLKGSLSLTHTSAGNATVDNAQELWVDGGTLTSTLGTGSLGNVITGDVGVYNSGTLTVGSGSTVNSLSLTGGSLTVGASAPGQPNTAGTLTLNAGATLNFPAAAGLTSTFVVEGGPSAAVVNMNGATIAMAAARVAALDLEAGVLHSNSSALFANVIAGNLINNGKTIIINGQQVTYSGIVDFTGALNTLDVTGTYTQTSSGSLNIRLDNGEDSDDLAIGGSATLAGTLNLIAQASLTANQTWTVLTTGGTVGGFFSTINFPSDGNPFWDAFVRFPGDNAVDVTN